jgi:hypothetical protein
VLRFLVFLLLAGLLGYCGSTVKLGNRTFFGHVRAIWHSEEAQDLKQGVEQTAGPAVQRMERGIHAGVKAMRDDVKGRDAGDAMPVPAPVPSAAP